MNLLASPLPATVEIGGASVPIKVGFRTGIQVARAIESGLTGDLLTVTMLKLYFGGAYVGSPSEAMSTALSFFRCGDEETPKKKRAKRLIDWDHDAGTILADFRREYGIDLADPATRLHWWVFMAYFENLTAESGIKTAMYYRGVTKPKGLPQAEAEHFNRMKRAHALPPRTSAEAIAREATLWGDE